MKVTVLGIVTFGILSVAQIAMSQTSPGPKSLPSCAEDLSALASKLYDDYAGFRLEVKGAKRAHYDLMFGAARARAEKTSPADCYQVLDDYLAWFDDPHLFIYQSDAIDSAASRRLAANVRRIDMSEGQARALIASEGIRKDPIEGVWYDRNLRVAIVPDPKKRGGNFVAIILQPDTSSWPAGAVRATFKRRTNGTYSALVFNPDYSVAHRDGQIYKRLLLRLAPALWARTYPVADFEKGLVAPDDPRRPTLIVHGKTVVISIPSHDPSYGAQLDSLISSHTNDLRNASHIIVDLRGNEGGSSGMTNALRPYIVTRDKRRTKYTTDYGEAVILSSPDQISYAHRGFGSDTTEFARSLIRRMTGHLGEMVPLRDPSKPAEQEAPDSVIDGSWKVGVLVDHGTVSASEVMVLDALRSKRATVFGEPTEGALDYQSTRIVWFSPRERRWGLGYPTITSHASLPVGGMRGKGIEPDVRLDLKNLRDPVATVDALLGNRGVFSH